MNESERRYRRNMALALLGLRMSTLVNGKPLLQEDIADKAGISVRFYGKIERGEATPTIYVLSKIAFAYNTTLSEFCKQLAL